MILRRAEPIPAGLLKTLSPSSRLRYDKRSLKMHLLHLSPQQNQYFTPETHGRRICVDNPINLGAQPTNQTKQTRLSQLAF